MYYFLVWLQGLTTLVTFAEFLYISHQGNSRHRTILMLLTLAAWINNAGYFVEILSVSRDTALIGTKICYLGKSFIPLLILLLGLNYCNIRVSNVLLAILAVFHAGIWALVISCDYQDLFYTQVTFAEGTMFPHLVIGHGPLYYVFMGLAGIYLLSTGVILIRQHRIETNKNRKRQINGMLWMALVAIAGLVPVILGCTGGYDTTALAYAVGSLTLLWGILKYDFLDNMVEAKEYALNRLNEGIVLLDSDRQLIYRNQMAKSVLPETGGDALEQEQFQRDGRVIQIDRQTMKPKQGSEVYLYLLKDITDSYYYEEKLRQDVEAQTRRAEQQAKVARERSRMLEQLSLQIVSALADTIDAKDQYTKGHSFRVSRYAVRLAEEMGYSSEELSNLRHVALLHDIGKISIPDAVLNKPDKLTDVEYELIKSHARVGGDILQNIAAMPGIEEGARYHHERYDGRGYPEGLSGEDIPEVARIICLADSYDAMNSRRVYRHCLTKEKIRSELVKGRGTQFDPHMTDLFLRLFDEGALEELEDGDGAETAVESERLVLGESAAESADGKKKRDSLTGLPLRGDGEAAISEALRKKTGCLCVIDVDNLKEINDTQGHLAGDHLLTEVGEVLKGYGEQSILCRHGGDEFLMFLEDADRERAERTVAELMQAFRERRAGDANMASASLSVGMCMSRRNDEFARVLGRAEKALYHVKQSGKDDYYIYQRKSERLREESNVDMSRLIRSLRSSGNYSGALDVEYRVFTKLYEYVRNLEKRYGYEFDLALVTLEPQTDVTVDEQEQAMNAMERAIRSTIRSTDICSRYSGVQFLIIFTQVGESNIKMVMNRILESYLKLYHGGHMEASYEIADMMMEDGRENSQK